MSSYPDFHEQGYQVIRELGRNREGGRITWLAKNINTRQEEVIKQFCFAQAGSNWSSFAAHEREIQILKGLEHPGIPSYLNSFTTSDGFCLVQQYINAPTLAEPRSFAPEEIKQIAVKVLEILVYLQNRIPSVIHRDIKPENILVDEQINVYLIDFGFARIGSQEVAASSVFKGTPGFIPPEQMFKPTDATDLYALGVTLICLLTGTKSTEIQNLQDEDDPYLIKFRHLLPRLSLRFLDWLEKIVKPQQKERYANAEAALEALKPLDVIRVPIVNFSQTLLEFQAQKVGEKLTQSITLNNSVQETVLEGKWEVAPHPHDPPHTPDSHAWISVKPAKFKSNNIEFCIQVDTNNLMAQKQYKRQLILHSNTYPENHTFTVKVQTAALPIEKRKLTSNASIKLFLTATVVAMATTLFVTYAASAFVSWLLQTLGDGGIGFLSIIAIIHIFCVIYSLINTDESTVFLAVAKAVANIVAGAVGIVGLAVYVAVQVTGGGIDWTISLVMGVVGLAVYVAVYLTVVASVDWAIGLAEDSFTFVLILLTLGFGASVGTGMVTGFLNPFILLALTGTGLPRLFMLLYSFFKRRRLIAKYRQSEESLIKP